MDRQSARDVAAATTLALLAVRARDLGVLRRSGPTFLEVTTAEGPARLQWRVRDFTPKSRIEALVHGSEAVLACPTIPYRGQTEPPFLPGCAKPDRGSSGRGFVAFRSAREWDRCRRALSRTMVLQPLLDGVEYRITVCHSGTYAAARLVGRRGRLTLWRDVRSIREPLLEDLHRIVVTLGVPGLGFDVIRRGPRAYLIDVNAAPSLRIHLATDRPRDLVPAFLADWMALTSRRQGPEPS